MQFIPGEHLAEQLEALEMSAAALARRLKVPRRTQAATQGK
jgi:plasmid maintenance system antidote protein VapI